MSREPELGLWPGGSDVEPRLNESQPEPREWRQQRPVLPVYSVLAPDRLWQPPYRLTKSSESKVMTTGNERPIVLPIDGPTARAFAATVGSYLDLIRQSTHSPEDRQTLLNSIRRQIWEPSLEYVTDPASRPLIAEALEQVQLRPIDVLMQVRNTSSKVSHERITDQRISMLIGERQLLLKRQRIHPKDEKSALRLIRSFQTLEMVYARAGFQEQIQFELWLKARDQHVEEMSDFTDDLLINGGYPPLDVAAVVRIVTAHPSKKLLGDVID